MSYLTLNEGAAPSTPASGKGSWYIDTNGEPKFIDDNGVNISLAPKWKYNWVRNGGFWFAQRQVPGTLTTYSNLTGRAISADGWGITNENASVQYRRIDTATAAETGLAARFYGEFTKITSAGKVVVSQVMEGFDTANLRGSTVRLQVLMRSIGTSLTARLALAYLNTGTPDTGMPATFISAFGANGVDPTLGANLTYITPKAGINADGGTVDGDGVDCALTTGTWVRYGAVFDVPASARNLVLLVFSDSQLATSSGIAISQVTVADGQAIQDWSPQSYAEELSRVQRFYSKSFAVDTAPAQNAGVAGSVRGYVNIAGATAGQIMGARWPVLMRAAPTVTFYNPSAANAFVRNTAGATDATATTAAATHEQSMDVTFTGIAAWAVGQALAVHYSADAEI